MAQAASPAAAEAVYTERIYVMSFFDTLKQFGLWPQQGEQGGQPQANPYGLDDGMMRQARMQSLSNLGSQIMAASVQQTPRQRAELMSGFDMTGGYQDNLYNAAQQKLMSAKMQAAQRELDQTEKMKISLANRLQSLPPGQLRDAAMWFYEAGDYNKAGEILFKREKVFNPYTMQDEYRDAFGDPAGGGYSPAAGPAAATAVPAAASGQPASVAMPAAADGGAPALPPVTEGASSNQVTNTYRRIFQDPSLTDQEAMIIAGQGTSKEAIFKAYQEVLKQRVDVADKKRIATKDQSEMANSVIDDRRSEMELPQRVVDFAQSIDDVLSTGDPTSMRALATQVLFAKVLDPGSAFMTGEADLQQSAASWSQRVGRFLDSTTEGTPLPKELVLEMQAIARQLGRRALTKLERIDKQASTRAGASGLTDDMLGGKFPLRWNRFADPGLDETGTSRREPPAQVLNDIDTYGG